MLVLSRKRDETLIFYTSDGPIAVTVCDCRGDRVRLGCEAPANVKILRKELEGVPSAQPPAAHVPPQKTQ